MRKALNENPVVQMVVFGIVGLILVVMLFTTVLKKDEAPATEGTAATDPAATATEAPAATGAPAPTTSGTTAPTTPVPDPEAAASADGLLPTRGLPEDLLVAYAKDQAIALLVVDPNGTADKEVEEYTQRLASRDDVEVFVVNVKDIAKYSRVTSGVAVSRAPALVVITPRKLTDNVPTASVSYGFRSPRSVEQALDDSLYEGKQLSAYP